MREYNAIVVGAGVGGLTAADLLARAGQQVLVLERSQTVGGAATVYRHGGLTIDASLHEINGLDTDDPKASLFQYLGLDTLKLASVPETYEVRGGPVVAPFVLPLGPQAALAAAKARFPEHGEAIERFL